MWPALLCMVRLVTMEPVLRHLRPWKEDEREKVWEWAGAGGQAGADHLPGKRVHRGHRGRAGHTWLARQASNTNIEHPAVKENFFLH